MSERVAILFLARILSAIRASGGTVTLYPFGDLEADAVASLLRAIMLTKDTERSREHLDVSGTAGEDGTSPKQKLKSVEKVVIRTGNGPEKKPIVNVIEPGMLEYSLKPESGRRLALLTALLRSSVNLTVLITKRSDRRVMRGMSGLVERRIKIIDRNGVLFVLPEVPWSGAFVMNMEKRPHPRMDLEPVV